MKKKRSLFKTWILMLIRYNRMKMNPKYMDKIYFIESQNPKPNF